MNPQSGSSTVAAEDFPADGAALEERLSRPDAALSRALPEIEGDFLILGAGGKMGPSLARMLRRGLESCGESGRRVLAAARFSDEAARTLLEAAGVETLRCDLTDRAQVAALPEVRNIIYMAGQKFGSSAAPEATWGMNCYVPVLVSERFRDARMVIFSTGCVYPLVPVASGGSREEDALEPPGEYAASCVGRERLFSYFSLQYGTPMLLFRLNYAVDLRYGVLVDIAQKVLAGSPVDVTMGHVNVIWQGDACSYAIRSLQYASSPPLALNATGPETISVRSVAHRFAELFGCQAQITGREAETALLADASRCHDLLGYPEVSLNRLIFWVAEWLRRGGRTLGKPTHFEVRDGAF